ncbi:UNVERIFIED_CONTAM: RNA recognition motif-containing protein [Hammondia hammondi]|eukprot:XP_008889251.1 RNA recognition motif-containing protein [Hammondia hammondi]
MTQSMLDMSLDDIVAAHREAAGNSSGRGGRGRGGGFGSRRGSLRGSPGGNSGFLSRGRGRGFSSWTSQEHWEGRSHAFFPRRSAASPFFSDRGEGRLGPARRGGRDGFARERPREPTAVVRVSNLDYSVLEEDLKELFAAVGEVIKVWIDYDRTDRSKGTGGCIFRSVSDAKRAIEVYEGRRLEGLPLRLELQPPRQEYRRSPFGPYSQDFSRRDRGSWRGVQDVELW